MLCWYLKKPKQKKGKHPWVSDWSAFLHCLSRVAERAAFLRPSSPGWLELSNMGCISGSPIAEGGVCCSVMGVLAIKHHFCLEGVIGQSAVSQSRKAWPSSLERDMGMLITCSHRVLSYFKKYVWSEFIFHVQCILEFLLFLLESGR